MTPYPTGPVNAATVDANSNPKAADAALITIQVARLRG
jgi:hypothetical protein